MYPEQDKRRHYARGAHPVVFWLVICGLTFLAGGASAYETGGVEDDGYVISAENRAKIMSALPDQAPQSI